MSLQSTTTQRPTEPLASPSDLISVFDLEMLLDRCMGEAALAVKLLGRFTERLPASISEINKTLAAGDRSETLKHVHTLKGEAGSLAAVRVQKSATALETCVRDATDLNHPDIVALTAALAAAADQCRQRVAEAIDALSTSALYA
jgi:HPt (histidine-containing phosphotransfer) domain-containing protein